MGGIQLNQLTDDVARTKIGSIAGEELDNFITLLEDKFNKPLDVSLLVNVLTIEAGKKQKLESNSSDGTQNSYKWRLPLIDEQDVNPVQSTIDLSDGTVTGDFNSPATSKSMTASYYVQMGVELRSDGKLYVAWGTEAATSGATTPPAFETDAFPILIAKLQDSGGGGAWNFNTPSKSDIEVIAGGAGVGGGGGGTEFKLARVEGTSAIIKKGRWDDPDGNSLITGNITTDVPLNLSIDLSSIIASPSNSTAYHMYIDMDKLSDPVQLTDTKNWYRKVYDVTHFVLSTLTPHQIGRLRYRWLGSITTVAAGNTWVGSVVRSSPQRVQQELNSFFPYVKKKVVQITSATTTSITHGLSGVPNTIECWFYDASTSKRTPLPNSSFVTDANSTSVAIDSTSLTFDTSDYLEVIIIYNPQLSDSFASSSHSSKSPWYTDTATTQWAHGLVSMDDVIGVVVQEWNTTTGKRRPIELSSIVSGFDDTYVYFDWSGFTPSSTLKYRVCIGSAALPHAGVMAKKNVFTFLTTGLLTESTSSYEVELPENSGDDNLSDIRGIQKFGSRWTPVLLQGLCGVESSGGKWYLRGNIDSLVPSASNPVKIICQPNSPIIEERVEDPLLVSTPGALVYTEWQKLVSSPGTAGQVKQGHIIDYRSFRAALRGTGLSYWNLREDLLDKSANTRTLTAFGTPGFTGTSIFGEANKVLSLNGSSQYLYLSSSFFNPGNTNFSFGGNFSLTDWTPSATMVLLSNGVSGTDLGFRLRVNTDGAIWLTYPTSATTDTELIIPNPGFANNSWHRIDVRYTAATGKWEVFIDGVNTGYSVVQTMRSTVGNAFYVGRDYGGGYVGGLVGDIFFASGIALTDHDIKKIGSTRLDHGKNIQTYRQNWIFNHYPEGVDPATDLQGVVVDKSDPSCMFADFSGCLATDRVDILMQDIGLDNVENLPVQNAIFEITATGDLTTSGTNKITNLQDNVQSIQVWKVDASGNRVAKNPADYSIKVTGSAPRYLQGDVDSLTPSTSQPVIIIVSCVPTALALSDATTTVGGIVSAIKQAIGGLKQFFGGVSSVEYVGTNPECGGSSPFQVLPTNKRVMNINPAGAITVKLPTTVGGDVIKAGEKVVIRNRSTYEVTVQSSGGNAVDIIAQGYIVCRALVDAPTGSADWDVEDVFEKASPIVRFAESGGSNYYERATTFTRRNNIVTFGEIYFEVTMSANGYIAVIPAYFPARFRPSLTMQLLIVARDGTSDSTAMIAIDSSGNMNIYKNIDAANFTSGLLARPWRGNIIGPVVWTK